MKRAYAIALALALTTAAAAQTPAKVLELIEGSSWQVSETWETVADSQYQVLESGPDVADRLLAPDGTPAVVLAQVGDTLYVRFSVSPLRRYVIDREFLLENATEQSIQDLAGTLAVIRAIRERQAAAP